MKLRTPCSGRIVLAALVLAGVADVVSAQNASAGGAAVTVTLVRWPYT
jgi:hypothetical protein